MNDLRQFDFDENRNQLKNIHLAKVAELSEKHIALNMMNIDRQNLLRNYNDRLRTKAARDKSSFTSGDYGNATFFT